ncbi:MULTISPECIES: DUF3955 domain-containing protein [Vibrio]|uniref:DUF3955 domain-containing protein n=1 Tax=Vibrio mediterranei TaxID=689 RepID=A0A2C9PCB1_9VIBR|nr:hypothetical protein BSZ05_11390 [Vibrio mediterranei]AYV22283.1 DUF3955 domain-containing protein [Vibrio mediterranei]NUW71751.1 DUF3955 domain-containing protein [Vibrio mediterranei]USE01405.1 DUF3955 domain-containing protein [Vibrio sp. SCSIO 43133]
MNCKKYRLTFILFGLANLCLAIFLMSDSYVDQSGVLVENFGFLALFWLLLFSSAISWFITFNRRRR